MLGTDYHSSLIEKANLNLDKYKSKILNDKSQVRFRQNDIVNGVNEFGKFNLCTFGFGVTLDLL